ncbi:MAG: hypothetical protein IKB64_01700 [Paludibacteraceae bacterium]|nr:hypothetical protein [Paludibacteraceae bacterium]
MLNIYEKIKRDFSILNEYGYEFDHYEHHNVMPSVVFRKNEKSLQIGMHYDDQKIFVLYYSKKNQLLGENLTENLQFYSIKYEKHIEKTKEILISFLQKNEIDKI